MWFWFHETQSRGPQWGSITSTADGLFLRLLTIDGKLSAPLTVDIWSENIFYVLKQILSFLFFLIIKNECYVSILRILGLNHIRLLRQYLVHF